MTATSKRLLIGTSNPGKLREWRDLLSGLPLDLVTPRDVGIDFEVAETGRSFAANALLKAVAYGEATGLLTLAEDSGLTVAALNGAPGVRSARWEGSDYVHKSSLLIALLSNKRESERACAYVCAVALREPDGRIWRVRGSARGQIAAAAAGHNGFGYDPIFLVPRINKTLAEVPEREKHRISHRGRAARRLRPILEQIAQRA